MINNINAFTNHKLHYQTIAIQLDLEKNAFRYWYKI